MGQLRRHENIFAVETYRAKAYVLATRVRQIEVNGRVQWVDGVALATELECDIHLLVAGELPDVTADFLPAYKRGIRNVLVECLRDSTVLGYQQCTQATCWKHIRWYLR